MELQKSIRPEILSARQRLAEGRAALRAEHDAGLPGPQLGYRLSDLYDSLLLASYQSALEQSGKPLTDRVALVVHGGLGRRDIAPYSDADVMVLYRGRQDDELTAFARRLHQTLYDIRLDIGFSFRSLRDVRELVFQDVVVLTSLSESRFLAGNAEFYNQYRESLLAWARRGGRRWLARIADARRQERHKYGETVYLLRPNVKRSRGGLRDVHLIRWLAFVAYGDNDWQRLEQLGILLPGERQQLMQAYAFLLRVRHELHFHAEKSQDILDRWEQLRLARLYGYEDDEQLLAVERFMRVYFEHTSQIRYISSHVLSGLLRRHGLVAFVGWLFSRRVDGHYTVGPFELAATRKGLAQLRGNLTEVMRLMELAALTGKRIAHHTWQAIRQDVDEQTHQPPPPEAIQRFLSMMSGGAGLGDLLRKLHQLRILERFVPPLAHARSLLQSNDYHKYTIDEHCIRAVELATGFAQDQGLLGELYRGLARKRTLHLALLLHDLGKGYGEDHSVVGSRLARQTCQYLGLSSLETETVVGLVQRHLLMAHTAWRHDLGNESVVAGFAREVGSVEFLRMLFLLTCADIQAVGPGAFSQWKFDLLTELYERTLEQLSPEMAGLGFRQRLFTVRQRLRAMVPVSDHQDWIRKQIECLPAGYLRPGKEQQVLEELTKLAQLPRGQALAWGRFLPSQQAVEYTIGTTDDAVPGIFHRLTGVLTSTGHSILSAEIHTLADQLVLDRFYVQDLDFAGEPPAERMKEVCQKLIDAICKPSEGRPTFRRLWRSSQTLSALPVLPERVHWDNATSDRHTIITVFAYDRMGLLYEITRTLFELGLSVHVAKVGTYLDQVVDVFYVTDQKGQKIQDEARLEQIRTTLLEALVAHARQEGLAGTETVQLAKPP